LRPTAHGYDDLDADQIIRRRDRGADGIAKALEPANTPAKKKVVREERRSSGLRDF
jgi:hypothetical protein